MGYCDPNGSASGIFSEFNYLGDDNSVEGFCAGEVLLVNGLGSVSTAGRRTILFDRFKEKRCRFATVVHPSAIIARDVQLGEGCQIMAGAVIQAGVRCGDNVIINTHSSVDHDSSVGAHTHISIGSTVSGDVDIGEKVYVGAGSTVIQGVSIGTGCLIAAGAVVIRDVADYERVAGVPARRMKNKTT